MDFDPALRLTIDDGETIDVTRDNAALYTFAGELSSRDHVYIVFMDGETPAARYVFKPHSEFLKISRLMIENGYVCHLNQRSVHDDDETAFQVFLDASVSGMHIPDSLPTDFS